MKHAFILCAVVALCLPASATLIVAVATREGIAMAADGRLNRVTSSGDHQVVSDLQPKLIDVDGRFLIAMGGKSHLGSRPVWMVVRELATELVGRKDVDQLAAALGKGLSAIYRDRVRGSTDEPNIRLILAGYADDIGKVYELIVPDAKVTLLASTREPRMVWTGDTAIADRLILGVDKKVLEDPRWSKEDRAALRKEEFLFSTGEMPVAEAVDLATTTIDVSIRMSRFMRGTVRQPEVFHPTIGGPIDAAVVSPTGVHWVRRKAVY